MACTVAFGFRNTNSGLTLGRVCSGSRLRKALAAASASVWAAPSIPRSAARSSGAAAGIGPPVHVPSAQSHLAFVQPGYEGDTPAGVAST